MASFFAGQVARARAARVGELIGRWEPDLVVRDVVDFGAALAAEAAGLPHAAVAVIAAGRLTRPEVIELPLGEVRDELGLDPADAAGALHRHLLRAWCVFVPLTATSRPASEIDREIVIVARSRSRSLHRSPHNSLRRAPDVAATKMRLPSSS